MRTSIAARSPLLLLLSLWVPQACYSVAAQELRDREEVRNSVITSSSSSSSSSSALSLQQLDENEPPDAFNLRRGLKKQIGNCTGSKFQIVIHFDAHPEDFSMTLVNDDTNKTVWNVSDPKHNYSDPSFAHKTVEAGVCLPKDWCWVLTVYDKFGDGMFMRNMTIPGQGGGMRLLFNGLTANYYTGKFNGCYKSMWFRFGEYCSAQLEFGYEPGDTSLRGCGRFNVGRAPDDNWFAGNLYQVGTASPSVRQPTRAPVPSAPSPVRVGPTPRPAPSTSAPIRVGPADRPLHPKTHAPVRPPPNYQPFAIAPTKPVPAPTKPVPAPTKPVPAPTKPVPAPTKPVPAPTKPIPAPTKPVPAPTSSASQGKPVNPIFCHFGLCR